MNQKSKITMYSGVGLLSLAILTGGLKLYDSTIDHTHKICAITKVSCFLADDEIGSLHQQNEISKLGNSVDYYKYPEGSKASVFCMASVKEHTDENGVSSTIYTVPAGYTLNEDGTCSKVIDSSNESVLIIDNSKVLKLHK